MLFAIAALIGVVLAFLSGGRLRNLAQIRIRGELYLVIALVAVVGVPIIGRVRPEFTEPVYWAWMVSMAILALVAAMNLGSPGFAAILAGVLLNLAVILVNAGMPVSFGSMLAAGYAGVAPPDHLGPFGLHHLAAWGTSLLLMADVSPIQGPVLVRTIVSLGDVLLVVGVMVFIVWGSKSGVSDRVNPGLLRAKGARDDESARSPRE